MNTNANVVKILGMAGSLRRGSYNFHPQCHQKPAAGFSELDSSAERN